MSAGPPVLVPRGAPSPRPLPVWIVPVALVGLAALCLTTLPAALRHRRLARECARVEERLAAQRREVRRLQEDLRDARTAPWAFEAALRDLLHPRPATGR